MEGLGRVGWHDGGGRWAERHDSEVTAGRGRWWRPTAAVLVRQFTKRVRGGRGGASGVVEGGAAWWHIWVPPAAGGVGGCRLWGCASRQGEED
jgi:hypothetical protein